MDNSPPLEGNPSLAADLGSDLSEGLGASFFESSSVKSSALARNFIIALVLAIIFFLAGPLNLSAYTQTLISFALIFWGGRHFFKGLARDMRRRAATIDSLVSLSLWAALIAGSYRVFFPENLPPSMREPYGGFIIEVLLLATLGQFLEARFKDKRREIFKSLKRKISTSVRVVRAGKESFAFCSEIRPGDRVIARQGEEIPVDGRARSKGWLDESLLNDRKAFAAKSDGSRVLGGSFVRSESIEIEANGLESLFARVVSVILKSEVRKSEKLNPVNRQAAWIAGISIVFATLVSIFWALEAPAHRVLLALSSLSSVLILACPPSLALARPIAWICGFWKASRRGIVIVNPDSIERLSGIDTLLFDKTGVLTEGRPEVSAMTLTGESREELLSAALAALQNSPHLSAQAVARYALDLGAKPLPEPDSLESFPGRGIILKGRAGEICVGNLSWLKELGCALPPIAPLDPQETISLIGIARDFRLLGYFALKDALRSDATQTINQIKEMGITPILVSGDRNESAHRLAEQTGVRHVFAEVPPGEKELIVLRLQSEGKKVALLGSSFYDATALSAADWGIAWESGNSIAAAAADVVIKHTNLSEILVAIQWSRALRRGVRENVFLSLICSVVLTPLACGLFYRRYGLILRPWEAVVAGILGLALIIINSLRRDIHEFAK